MFFQATAIMVIKITLASNKEGWDIMMNGQLETALASDDRVEVSGFVPGYTQGREIRLKDSILHSTMQKTTLVSTQMSFFLTHLMILKLIF